MSRKEHSERQNETAAKIEPKRSISMADYESSATKESKSFIREKMSEIHSRISKEIMQQPNNDEKPYFKIFTDTVENKNDILRVSKERRFIRSQMSHNY